MPRPPAHGRIRPNNAPSLLFTSHDDLPWEPAIFSHAQFFNLYRDDVALMTIGASGSCRDTLPTNAYSDVDVPAPGVTWFYLVTARNGLGEGSMGQDSLGHEWNNTSPCP